MRKIGAPRCIFILRLATPYRLSTRDRLYQWHVTNSKTSPLCEKENRNVNHLLFLVTYVLQYGKNP